MTKVKLRKRATKNNGLSLYLDYYPPIIDPHTRKKSRREFLGLYLIEKPKTTKERKHNKEQLERAEAIRDKRQLAIQNRTYGILPSSSGKLDAVKYFKVITDEKTGSNYDNWLSAYNHFVNFTNGSIKFSEIDEMFCEDFKNYLLTTNSIRSEERKLAKNSAASYFSKFMAFLRIAYSKGILQIDLNSKVKHIQQEETHRNYLEMEELDRLANTKCEVLIVKNFALFLALTGQRFGDVAKMTWSEVEESKTAYKIRFRQQKTKGAEFLPITEQAYSLLGKRGAPDEQVFKGMKYSAYLNGILKKWVEKAKITKHITFHCFRHTHATLLLSQNVNLYTVSKLLGHKSIKTTQIYGKIVDQSKIDAVNKIKLDM
jgi:integrase